MIKDDLHIQSWAQEMFDINFPIFAKGAVVREGDANEQLPDVWGFLSGKLIYFTMTYLKENYSL